MAGRSLHDVVRDTIKEPRWISAWGLVAIPFYVASFLLPLYGIFEVNAPPQVLMYLPLAVQEMVLAVWMIARGFRPAAVSTTSERFVHAVLYTPKRARAAVSGSARTISGTRATTTTTPTSSGPSTHMNRAAANQLKSSRVW